jgi:hypothetical protein
MLGYNKKQNKKGQYRHFAVSQRTAKVPCGSNLCNLGVLGLTHLVIMPSAGRRQRRVVLCRLQADGKEKERQTAKSVEE